jgi:hypothetical protein
MTMLTPIHVENSGPLLGSNQPVGAHVSDKNGLHPLRRNGSSLVQVATPREKKSKVDL